MTVPPSQQAIENFWTALQDVAKEVLAQGQTYGYGFSVIEIKFKDGLPSVAINSHTESRLYRSHDEAVGDIINLVQNTRQKGSASFTVVREEDGNIKRLLLDEYSMRILKEG